MSRRSTCRAMIVSAGVLGVWLSGAGAAAAAEGVPARASSYIKADVGLSTFNPDVSADSDCGTPQQVDIQRVGTTNVHNDACLFTAEAPRNADESDVDAPASFQSLGVGFITACPDPDGGGAKTARLSDSDVDGRNDLCTQSGFQTRGTDGDREYHARLNSATPGGQVVLFCHDPDRDGCFDERVLSVAVVVWLP